VNAKKIWRVAKPYLVAWTTARLEKRAIGHPWLLELRTKNVLEQRFPTFLWLCTPSAFRQMGMYP